MTGSPEPLPFSTDQSESFVPVMKRHQPQVKYQYVLLLVSNSQRCLSSFVPQGMFFICPHDVKHVRCAFSCDVKPLPLICPRQQQMTAFILAIHLIRPSFVPTKYCFVCLADVKDLELSFTCLSDVKHLTLLCSSDVQD